MDVLLNKYDWHSWKSAGMRWVATLRGAEWQDPNQQIKPVRPNE